jgi:signal transduction protein with GAF and PtsI domain
MIELHANIELPQDIAQAREVGAAGVGLFRTEFLFLNRDEHARRGGAVRGLPQRGQGHGGASRW